MEAMTPTFSKRSKSPGSRTWACSMRKRRAPGVGRAWLRLGDDVGVGAVSGGCGWEVRDLIGYSEGVEGHGVGAVADGVEA